MRSRFALILMLAALATGWAGLAQSRPGQLPAPQPKPTDALDGTWELITLIEDGKPIPSDIVKQTLLANSRITISGQLLAFSKPDGKVRTLAFVTDTTASPKRIDLAGAINLGSKGIYIRDGNTLLMCFSLSDTDARPSEFVAIPGKNTVVLTFRKVDAPAAALPPPPPPAPPPPPPRSTDADLQAALVGTWGHQTDDRIVKVTLNPDGSFSTVLSYKKGLKKVLDDEEHASGTWKVKDGMAIFTTSASSVRGQVGQVASYRVNSINAGEVIYVDNQTGQRRIEWKLR